MASGSAIRLGSDAASSMRTVMLRLASSGDAIATARCTIAERSTSARASGRGSRQVSAAAAPGSGQSRAELEADAQQAPRAGEVRGADGGRRGAGSRREEAAVTGPAGRVNHRAPGTLSEMEGPEQRNVVAA